MKRRKLFYVPGLVSLLGLPILLLIAGPEDPVVLTVMRLNLPSERIDTGQVMTFNRQGILRLLGHKKIETLYVTDRLSTRHPETNYYRESGFFMNELAKLAFTHDTDRALKVRFDEANDYGDFVWIVNTLKVFDIRRYMYLDNDVYILANPPPVEYTGPDLYVDNYTVQVETKKPTNWELFREWRDRRRWELIYWWREVSYAVRRNWILMTGFMLLIVLPPGVRLIKKKPAQSN
jgi:hypothetical protein